MGIFPLVPYSNRIGNGLLPLEGKAYALLRANFLPESHSIHGFGWQRVWQVEQQDATSVSLVLKHSPDDDWPFACECRMQFVLSEHGLSLQLSVRNDDAQTMPTGLGFHPYFPVDANTSLRACWSGYWMMNTDNLPVLHKVLDTPPQPRKVIDWHVDNCFTGWQGRATLNYISHRTVIEAGSECPYIVCFRPSDGRPFIALEPVSHVNNAHQLERRGVQPTGLKWLQTGQSFSTSMSINIVLESAISNDATNLSTSRAL
jgi:aldose 1-epimerase